MRRTIVGLIILLTLGILVAPVVATAQPRGKIPQVGALLLGAGMADGCSEGPPFGGSTLSQILAFARQHRLPTSSGGRHNATAGVLLAYGAHAHDLCQRSAVFVDKILKGVTPADLPVERAHKFEFIVNLTTAKSLDLTLPPTLLFQADDVLQ